MSKPALFTSESDLVAAFCAALPRRDSDTWTAYHETAGWDLLLVHKTGFQIGIEAKLKLNAKVLEQALPGRWVDHIGPDYRAVLVPGDGLQLHLERIARHLGVAVLVFEPARGGRYSDGHIRPSLPDEAWTHRMEPWPNWCPTHRCPLPDYVPDVIGGHAAPVALSTWKIQAIKLLLLLERNGAVTRRDMKALGLSPTRWTDAYHGFLSPGPEGYVRNGRTPDLKAQHPVNWDQIAADIDVWAKGVEVAGKLGLEVKA